MKKILQLLIVGVALVALSGCSMFRKQTAAAAPSPAIGQPSSSSAPSAANAAPVLSQQGGNMPRSANFTARRATSWVNYSVFDNLLDVRSAAASDATVLIVNPRPESVAIGVSDRIMATPDPNDNDTLGVLVIPPGGRFALRDYGLGPSTVVCAFILDVNLVPVATLEAKITWPQRGRQWGQEQRWDISTGPAQPIPVTGPNPVKLPTANSGNFSVTPLTPTTTSPAPTTPATTNP